MIWRCLGNRTWLEANRVGWAKGVGCGERGRSFRMALPGGANRIDGWPWPNRVVRHYLVLPERASCCVTPRSTPCLSGLDPGLFGAGCGIRRVGLRRVRPCRSVLRDRIARLTQPTHEARSARAGHAGVMWVSVALTPAPAPQQISAPLSVATQHVRSLKQRHIIQDLVVLNM